MFSKRTGIRRYKYHHWATHQSILGIEKVDPPPTGSFWNSVLYFSGIMGLHGSLKMGLLKKKYPKKCPTHGPPLLTFLRDISKHY